MEIIVYNNNIFSRKVFVIDYGVYINKYTQYIIIIPMSYIRITPVKSRTDTSVTHFFSSQFNWNGNLNRYRFHLEWNITQIHIDT